MSAHIKVKVMEGSSGEGRIEERGGDGAIESRSEIDVFDL